MASTATKAVSFRVPVDSYIELLQEAKESGLNMTDLLYTKIFHPKDQSAQDEAQELKHRIEALEIELSQANQSIKLIESQKKELLDNLDRLCFNFSSEIGDTLLENEQLKREYQSVLAESENYKEQISLFEQEKEDFIFNENQLLSENKRLNTNINNLDQMAHSVDEYKQEIKTLKLALKKADNTIQKLQTDNTELKKSIKETATQEERSKKNLTVQLRDSEKIATDLNKKLEALKKTNIIINHKLQAGQLQNNNLQIEIDELINAQTELRNTHNNQIIDLHKQISKWVSYTDNDVSLFNKIMWS